MPPRTLGCDAPPPLPSTEGRGEVAPPGGNVSTALPMDGSSRLPAPRRMRRARPPASSLTAPTATVEARRNAAEDVDGAGAGLGAVDARSRRPCAAAWSDSCCWRVACAASSRCVVTAAAAANDAAGLGAVPNRRDGVGGAPPAFVASGRVCAALVGVAAGGALYAGTSASSTESLSGSLPESPPDREWAGGSESEKAAGANESRRWCAKMTASAASFIVVSCDPMGSDALRR